MSEFYNPYKYKDIYSYSYDDLKIEERFQYDLNEDYRETARKQYQTGEANRIVEEYAERDPEEFSIPALKQILVPQTEIPKESEPGLKEKAKRFRLHMKNKDDGKRYTKFATELTLPIFRYENQYDQERRKAAEREKSASIKDIPKEQLAAIKKEFFTKKWHAYKFDQEYLGEHYAEVRDEMEQLRNFLEVIREDESLSKDEQDKVYNLKEIFAAMEKTVDAFQALHYVHREDVGVAQICPFPVYDEPEADYEHAKKSLREAISNDIKADMETVFLSLRVNHTKADFHVKNFLNKMGSDVYKTNYRQNKAWIDPMLSDLKKTAEWWEYAKMDAYDYQVAIAKLKEDGVDENDLRIVYAKDKIALLNVRVKAYQKRKDELMQAISYMMEGAESKQKDPSPEVLRLLTSYGVPIDGQVEIENKKSESIEYYISHSKEQAKLFEEACQRYIEKTGNTEVMENTKKLKKVASLMSSEDSAYNDRVLDIWIRKLELDNRNENYKSSDKGMEEIAYLAQEAEKILVPKLKAIMDYDLGNYRSLTIDGLILKQKEIYELTGITDICKELGEIMSDIPGLTLYEKILKKPVDEEKDEEALIKYQMMDDVLDYKKEILSSLRQQIRGAVQITQAKASADDTIPLESFMNESEIRNFKNRTKNWKGTEKEKLFRFGLNRILVAAAKVDETENNIGIHFAEKYHPDPELTNESDKIGDVRIDHDIIAKRYDDMEKKYGYDLPDLFWVVLHWDEMKLDAKNIKTDMIFLEKDKNALNKSDPKDMRLLHQMKFYEHYMEAALRIFSKGIEDEDRNFGQLEAIRLAMDKHMEEVSGDLAYLKGELWVNANEAMAVVSEIDQ